VRNSRSECAGGCYLLSSFFRAFIKTSSTSGTALLAVRATPDRALGSLLIDEVPHPLMILGPRRRRFCADNSGLHGSDQQHHEEDEN
jgi:hypothetical protein